jgi:hypothetical protein
LVLRTYKQPTTNFSGSPLSYYRCPQLRTTSYLQGYPLCRNMLVLLGLPVSRCLQFNAPLHAVLRSPVGTEVPILPYQFRSNKSRNALLSTRQHLSLDHVLGAPVTTESPTPFVILTLGLQAHTTALTLQVYKQPTTYGATYSVVSARAHEQLRVAISATSDLVLQVHVQLTLPSAIPLISLDPGRLL